MINAHGRALQHLLVQGFTLYTAPAAVCTRLAGARQILDEPQHSWAVTFDSESIGWSSMLSDDDPLKTQFDEAAVRSARPREPHVVCHAEGERIICPLTVDDVRDVRMTLEAAIALQRAPARELQAIPDDLLERELRRRELVRERASLPPEPIPDENTG